MKFLDKIKSLLKSDKLVDTTSRALELKKIEMSDDELIDGNVGESIKLLKQEARSLNKDKEKSFELLTNYLNNNFNQLNFNQFKSILNERLKYNKNEFTLSENISMYERRYSDKLPVSKKLQFIDHVKRIDKKFAESYLEEQIDINKIKDIYELIDISNAYLMFNKFDKSFQMCSLAIQVASKIIEWEDYFRSFSIIFKQQAKIGDKEKKIFDELINFVYSECYTLISDFHPLSFHMNYERFENRFKREVKDILDKTDQTNEESKENYLSTIFEFIEKLPFEVGFERNWLNKTRKIPTDYNYMEIRDSKFNYNNIQKTMVYVVNNVQSIEKML